MELSEKALETELEGLIKQQNSAAVDLERITGAIMMVQALIKKLKEEPKDAELKVQGNTSL